MRYKPGVFALCTLFTQPAQAQPGAFATKVISYDTNRQAGGGIFDPAKALGPPVASNLAVHSLGVGGYLTLGFDVTITDGPGADFLVFENAFAISAGGPIFSEAVFVEVSSNGQDFARFPTLYQGPAASGGRYATSWAGYFTGFAGIKPSNGGKAGVSNFDVVQAGGDSFDLADLTSHPLVLAGKVDLARISQVRMVDVIAGVSRDSSGNIIQDPTAGSADINAIAVIHHTGNVQGNGPAVALKIPKNGNFSIQLHDPAGLTNLDPASLRTSLDGLEIPVIILLQMMSVTQLHTTSITLQFGSALPPGMLFQLAVSVRNKTGYLSGQNRTR